MDMALDDLVKEVSARGRAAGSGGGLTGEKKPVAEGQQEGRDEGPGRGHQEGGPEEGGQGGDPEEGAEEEGAGQKEARGEEEEGAHPSLALSLPAGSRGDARHGGCERPARWSTRMG